jgi:hypothetical protein
MINLMTHLIGALGARLDTLRRDETGAAAALIIGIVIGAALVIFGIIKFLIPGE